jgi:hypothetical protein
VTAPETSAAVDAQAQQQETEQEAAGATQQPVATDNAFAGATQSPVQSASALLISQADLAVDALQALETASDVAAWLPQIADAIHYGVPVNIAAIERGLREVLDEINSLATGAAQQVKADYATSRVTVLLAVMAAALLVLELRRPRPKPMLVFNAANSSWSWMLKSTSRLGSSSPSRSRRDSTPGGQP